MTQSFVFLLLQLAGVWSQLFLEWGFWCFGGVSPLPGWVAIVPSFGYLLWCWTKRTNRPVVPWGFLPILVLGFCKIPLPDRAHDSLYYHVYLQTFDFVRLASSDFMPGGVGTYLFPVGDRLFGIYRDLLGYRAATGLNTLALWVLYTQLGRFFPRRAAWAGFIILSTEYLLLNTGVYHIDLLPLPGLLAMLSLIYKARSPGSLSRRELGAFAILLGLTLAIKITQAPFVVALGAWLFLELRGKTRVHLGCACALAAVVALLPFLHFTWVDTGNPLFFLYNKFFKSPYFPEKGFRDERWGPELHWASFVFYPVLMTFQKLRVSELFFYSGRILLLFISFWPARRERLLWVALLCLWLWEIGSGYIRYGLFIEILAGMLAVRICLEDKNTVVRGLVGACLLVQVFNTYQIVYARPDWNTRNIRNFPWADWKREASQLFQDTTRNTQSSAIAEATAWVSFTHATGAGVVANGHIPLVQTDIWWRDLCPAAQTRMQERLRAQVMGGSRAYTFYSPHEEPVVHERMREWGLLAEGEAFPCFRHPQAGEPFGIFCQRVRLGD